jgi:hypothetical protein
MSRSTRRTSVAVNALVAFYLPTMLLAFGIPSALSQCSQETRPEPASLAQPAAALPSNRPVPTRDSSSSSSGTAMDVRFATGSAITVLEDTPLQVITDALISSRTTKAGAKIPFTVTRDVVVDGVLVIPCGARVYGTVVSAKQAGRLAGASNLTLELTELDLDGRTYPLYTPPFKVVGESKTRPTVNKAAAGAAVGALAMDVHTQRVDGTAQKGARLRADGIAAGLGAGVGTAIAASSPPSIALIPAESQMEFTLTSPIAVFPVDQRTASRLARGMHHGGPALYIRGESQ